MTRVTVNGHAIGEWKPMGLKAELHADLDLGELDPRLRYPTLEEATAQQTRERQEDAAARLKRSRAAAAQMDALFNTRPFRPVPKK